MIEVRKDEVVALRKRIAELEWLCRSLEEDRDAKRMELMNLKRLMRTQASPLNQE
jgi:hypothetical protein